MSLPSRPHTIISITTSTPTTTHYTQQIKRLKKHTHIHTTYSDINIVDMNIGNINTNTHIIKVIIGIYYCH